MRNYPFLLKKKKPMLQVRYVFRGCFWKWLDSICFLPLSTYKIRKTNWIKWGAWLHMNVQEQLAWSEQGAVDERFVSLTLIALFTYNLLKCCLTKEEIIKIYIINIKGRKIFYQGPQNHSKACPEIQWNRKCWRPTPKAKMSCN